MFRNPATDLIVILVIVLLVMGPKRLPGLGRGLGQGMREFKDGITGVFNHDDEKPELSEAAQMPEGSAQDRAAQPAATPSSGSAPTDAGSEHRS
jgi:sec-independent protein translocase protein TatA